VFPKLEEQTTRLNLDNNPTSFPPHFARAFPAKQKRHKRQRRHLPLNATNFSQAHLTLKYSNLRKDFNSLFSLESKLLMGSPLIPV
jgi:hypothetical protein